MENFLSNFWVFTAIAGVFLGFWIGWAAAWVKGGVNFQYFFERSEVLEEENKSLRARVTRQAATIRELQEWVYNSRTEGETFEDFARDMGWM